MKSFIKKYRLVLVILFVGAGVVFFLLNRAGGQPPTPSPSPTPQPFVLERSFPPSGKQELGDTGLALSFTFSSPVDLSSLIVTLKPYVSFNIFTDQSGKTLYLKPLPKWDYNVEYKINISLKSKDGKGLDSPIEQVFVFTQMKNSPLSE
jgi:hypothetical protein